MGLGTYVPAMHLLEYLRGQGHTVTLDVFENYFSEDVLNKYLKNKKEYHKSFKVAKLGHKLAEKKLGSVIEEETEEAILAEWEKEEIQNFVILSGNWIPTVENYRKRVKDDSKLRGIVVHIDVGTAPSWKHFQNEDGFYKVIVPVDENGIHYVFEIPYEKKEQEYPREEKVFCVHGGGWGMGDYRDRKKELQDALNCRIVELAHAPEEVQDGQKTTYTIMDTDWKPWIPDESGEYVFPVMRDGNTGEKLDNRNMKQVYKIYEDCTGIISKPGGGTMLDAIATEIPLVLLEPVGEHERTNQEAYEACGMAMTFSDWKESGYSIQALKDIREAIQKNKAGKPGLGAYIETILSGGVS